MPVPPRNCGCGAPQGGIVGAPVVRARQSHLRATPIGDAKTESNYKQPLGGRPAATSEDAVSEDAAWLYSSNSCAPIAQALYAACASMGASRPRVRS